MKARCFSNGLSRKDIMIRVFPNRTNWTPTDALAFIGDPPLFRPAQMPVRISVTFSWDLLEGRRLLKAWADYYNDVKIGGPALGDPGGDFEPGRFLKEGVTMTSRGCPKTCKFCFVPEREGAVRELPIKEGWIVQDNNLLACSKKHIRAVFEMLKTQPEPAEFAGGLDTIYLQDWHRDLLDSIRLKQMFFACDTPAGIKPLERAARILDGISQNKRRCYTLIGFNGEKLADAERRLERVYDLGFLPFAQLYQEEKKIEYSKEWRRLARTFSRPAGTRAHMKTKAAA